MLWVCSSCLLSHCLCFQPFCLISSQPPQTPRAPSGLVRNRHKQHCSYVSLFLSHRDILHSTCMLLAVQCRRLCGEVHNTLDHGGHSVPNMTFALWPLNSHGFIVQFGKNPFVLLLLSTLRVTFVPLFLLCNVWVAGKRTIPLIFNYDVFPVVFNLLFGLSNGYLSSVAMVTAPQ